MKCAAFAAADAAAPPDRYLGRLSFCARPPASLIFFRRLVNGADMSILFSRLIQAAAVGAAICCGAPSIGLAQHIKDPPWNPDHIDHLPQEVRRAVLAMCPKSPSAAHYFATYTQDSQHINLHFEKLHCEQGPAFCTAAGCLHQVYALAAGRYHLVKSFYGSGND